MAFRYIATQIDGDESFKKAAAVAVHTEIHAAIILVMYTKWSYYICNVTNPSRYLISSVFPLRTGNHLLSFR